MNTPETTPDKEALADAIHAKVDELDPLIAAAEAAGLIVRISYDTKNTMRLLYPNAPRGQLRAYLSEEKVFHFKRKEGAK